MASFENPVENSMASLATDEPPCDLESVFESATLNVQLRHKSLSSTDLLNFYAYYKQVKDGPCDVDKPSFWDITAKQKWEAWKKLGNVSREEAMKAYIGLLGKIDPEWKKTNSSEQEKKTTFGVSVSKMEKSDDGVADNAQTPFDWVKDNNLDKLVSAESSTSFDINMKDENGLNLLHWASDRGFLHIVSHLLQKGATVNERDSEGLTALHYACTCDHIDVVNYLLQNGADPRIKDLEGNKPEDYLSNKELMQRLLNYS